MSKALVLLSGGMDSTICLYWAKEHFENVNALSINYGQKHLIEVECARKIANFANVSWDLISIDILKDIGDSALVTHGNVNVKHRSSPDLPASFVPGRNILLLTIAGIYAYKLDINNLVGGMCQTDSSGYPDCRRTCIGSLADTLTYGMNRDLQIHTPLMYLTKAEALKMAISFEGCVTALGYSHTCYNGKRPPCMECPACKLREKGFIEAGLSDPLLTTT